jgi:hypothetical protein
LWAAFGIGHWQLLGSEHMAVQLQQSTIVVAFGLAVLLLFAVLSVVSAAARAAQAVPSTTGAVHTC